MIEYRKGNLLDVDCGIIVHGCNCKGVMGSGVAKAVKEKYPDCYEQYKFSLNKSKGKYGEVLNFPYFLGEVIWYSQMFHKPSNKALLIANALTQENFGREQGVQYVSYEAVESCFEEVINQLEHMLLAYNMKLDLHFPKIGAGLGGGDWDVIAGIIEKSDPEDKFKKICWEL